MEYPKRKHTRLQNYDYSLPGYYYVTIHTQEPHFRLSHIDLVGEEIRVHLTAFGKLAQQQLLALEERYPHAKIDKYVIMPTHIHAIIQLGMGELPRPDLTDMICAYKSLTTRACNQAGQTAGRKLFQTSFYETVLRNEAAYQKCWQYIDQNPIKWVLHEDMPEFEP